MSAPTHQPHLTWEKKPLSALLTLAWPTAVSMVSYSAMTLVDTLFVGRIGPAALAGVGFAGVAAFTLMCFPIGLVRAAKILVSQEVGAGRRSSIAPILGSGLVLAGVLGALTLGAAFGISPFIASLGGGGEAGLHATRYFDIRLWFAPIVLAYNALREVRFGTGDARSPMIAALAANVANVVLNWWFIFGLEWGVAGSAWATNLACVLEAGILVFAHRAAGDSISFRAIRRHVRQLASLGVPTGIQFFLEMGSFALLAALISSMGAIQMAGHQIAMQVLQFSFLPAIAVGEAASVMAGQAVGASRLELVGLVSRRALKVTFGYTLLCGAAFVFGGKAIAAGFTDDPALALVTLHLLFVGAAFQIVDGSNIVLRGVLRGTGDVKFAAVFGVIVAWVCTPPLTWLFGHHMGLGAMGGWIGLSAEILVGTIVFGLRLHKGGWKRIAALVRERSDEVAGAAALTEPLAA